MKKTKEIMRDVARVAASTYAFVALAIMSAMTAVASLPSGYVECAFAIEDGSPVVDVYGNIMKPKSLGRLVLTESPIYVMGSFRPLRSDTARATKGEK